MRFIHVIEAIASFASLASAGPVLRQTSNLVANLGGWVENLAARSNGQLLLNRIDVPQLWNLDPSTGNTTKLLSFENALGLTGITELSPDIFIVIAGNFNSTSFDIGVGSYAVYKVDFRKGAPVSSLVTKVPESKFMIGVTPFNEDIVFIADAGAGSLYSLTVSTGKYGVVMSDLSMESPPGAFLTEGIHGVKYRSGTLYFTNAMNNTFNKVTIDERTGKPTGCVTTLVTGLPGAEDFCLAPRGTTAYIATLTGGALYKIAGTNSTKSVTAASGSDCTFGRGATDKNTIYVSTSSGAIYSADLSQTF